MTKYLMTWKPNTSGTAAENEESLKRSLAVFSNWAPPDELTFHEFLLRADGQGGCAIVSTDDIMVATREIARFTTFNEFDLTPVVEIAEGIGTATEAIAFRDAIG